MNGMGNIGRAHRQVGDARNSPACSTASIASARMALAMRSWSARERASGPAAGMCDIGASAAVAAEERVLHDQRQNAPGRGAVLQNGHVERGTDVLLGTAEGWKSIARPGAVRVMHRLERKMRVKRWTF